METQETMGRELQNNIWQKKNVSCVSQWDFGFMEWTWIFEATWSEGVGIVVYDICGRFNAINGMNIYTFFFLLPPKS